MFTRVTLLLSLALSGCLLRANQSYDENHDDLGVVSADLLGCLTNPAACLGSCTQDCATLPGVAAASCVAGSCVITACAPGRANCSGTTVTGCETDTTTSVHCGACDVSCQAPTALCATSGGQSSCVASCGGGTPTTCGSACVDTTSDPHNCGGCAHVCASGACVGSTCAAACAVGSHDCDGSCVSNQAVSSCGSSCAPCAAPANATATCDGTRCGFVCDSNFTPSPSGSSCVAAPSCPPAAQLIYTVDVDGTLSSFAPDASDVTKSVFTNIGTIACSVPANYSIFSMAVDRNATAWVEYAYQDALGTTTEPNLLFKVSTTDASCTATSFVGNQANYQQFGMGFVADSAGSTSETLYVADSAANGGTSTLGTLDLTTFMVTPTDGTTAVVNGDAELSGNSLGQLWAFIPGAGTTATTEARVSQLDRTTAVESNVILLPSLVGNPGQWAFACYGGDFYVFLGLQSSTGNNPTTVYHVTSSGLKDMLATSRNIVGAGVSTCAPSK